MKRWTKLAPLKSLAMAESLAAARLPKSLAGVAAAERPPDMIAKLRLGCLPGPRCWLAVISREMEMTRRETLEQQQQAAASGSLAGGDFLVA